MYGKSALLISLLFFLFLPLQAQQDTTLENQKADSLLRIFLHKLEAPREPGDVVIDQDPRVTRILRKLYEYRKNKPVRGWKVLIYRGRDRNQAYAIQADFVEHYGHLGLPVTVNYQEPDFFTLVGAFHTKEEAFRYRALIHGYFPNGYLVSEMMRINELERSWER